MPVSEAQRAMKDRRQGERRQVNRRDPNNAMIEALRLKQLRSPAERDADFQRCKGRVDAQERRQRGELPPTEAVCGFCDLPLPQEAFNPCEWNKPAHYVKYCRECRSFTGRRRRHNPSARIQGEP